jgi:hypothetical protein
VILEGEMILLGPLEMAGFVIAMRAMVPANPPLLFSVSCELAADPAGSVIDIGFPYWEKSALTALTFSLTFGSVGL